MGEFAASTPSVSAGELSAAQALVDTWDGEGLAQLRWLTRLCQTAAARLEGAPAALEPEAGAALLRLCGGISGLLPRISSLVDRRAEGERAPIQAVGAELQVALRALHRVFGTRSDA